MEAPTVEVMIRKLKMCAVVDTGSMINMISVALAEEMGLPAMPIPDRALDVLGIAGLGVWCDTWIARPTIYIMEGRIPMYGALFIVEKATFNIILGMPWIDRHSGIITRKERGSYLSWISGADRYEIKVYWANEEKESDKDEESGTESKEEERAPVKLYMAHLKEALATDQSCIPNSEEEERASSGLENFRASDEGMVANNRVVAWAEDQVAEWKRKWEGTDEDADDEDVNGEDMNDVNNEDKENQRPVSNKESLPISPPLLNQLAQGTAKGKHWEEQVYLKFKRSHKRQWMIMSNEEIIEVTEEMEEKIMKIQQEGGDMDDWEAFWKKEGWRWAKKANWFWWIKSEGETDDEGEGLPSNDTEGNDTDLERSVWKSQSPPMSNTLGTTMTRAIPIRPRPNSFSPTNAKVAAN